MGQKLALLIGNSDYQDTALAGLAKPIADVNGLAEVLEEPTIGAFDAVASLINCAAIVATVARLPRAQGA